ncbi:substrate-binding domain-containing protein [Vibrio vulnificus]|nr:substrate-binding domain-containing protein [Vibrio vulnificus]EID4421734.1 substrate-binding domain-containing protein [Vibrio vulnificus]ELV8611589.1 substrate-binding domain-containing protein [Vibrio vulnificus]MCU8135839.1 substrate-binding domain-containing protein [Vibrio vulnificus]
MKLINGCIATLAGLSLSAGAWAQESSRILVEQELMAVANDLIQSAELDITARKSSDVQGAMIDNQARLGISSRKWLDSEIALFEHKYGYRPTELFFTSDVISIVVNQENPIGAVTIDELELIFGCHEQPELMQWNKILGEEYQTIKPVAVENELTKHLNFAKLVECESPQSSLTQFYPERAQLIDAIADDKNLMGYTVYAELESGVRRLDIINRNGERFDLNKETILSGRYPLSNVYYLYLNLPPNRHYLTDAEKYFVGLTLGEEGQETIAEHGFISLPPEAIHRNRVRLSLDAPIVYGGYK